MTPEQIEQEMDRIWRRLNSLEKTVDTNAEDVREDVRELRRLCIERFNGVQTDLHPSLKKRVGSSFATGIAAATGVGVPIAVAWALSGGPPS